MFIDAKRSTFALSLEGEEADNGLFGTSEGKIEGGTPWKTVKLSHY